MQLCNVGSACKTIDVVVYTVKNGVLINTLNFIGECQCVLMSTPVFTNTRSGLTEHTN